MEGCHLSPSLWVCLPFLSPSQSPVGGALGQLGGSQGMQVARSSQREHTPQRQKGTTATVEGGVPIPHMACTADSALGIRVVPRSTEEGELSRRQGWEGRDPVLTSTYCARLPDECRPAPCLLEAPGRGGRRGARHSNRRDFWSH